MIILTAGDHRFRSMIGLCRAQAERFGYEFRYCDLGRLDLGSEGRIRFDDSLLAGGGMNERFAAKGYYLELEGGWRSHALHKPILVRECLRQGGETIAYLDGDAIPAAPLDEVMTRDYDVGVVMRPRGELTDMPEYSGVINAGVLFFRNTRRARELVEKWIVRTRALGNDQRALNEILFPGVECWHPFEEDWRYHTHLRPGLFAVGGLEVRLFDFRFNCFTAPLPRGYKILHFKGDYRRHFDPWWLRRAFGVADMGEEPGSGLFDRREREASKRGECPVVIDHRLFPYFPLFFLQDPVAYLLYRSRPGAPSRAHRSTEEDSTIFELPTFRRKAREVHIVAKLLELPHLSALSALMDPDGSCHFPEQVAGPVGYVLLGRRAVLLYKRAAPPS